MPGYVQQAVEKFQHRIKSPIKAIDAPHPYKATKKQGLPMTQPTDDAAKLSPQMIKHLQKIVVTFLFFQGCRSNNAHSPQHHSDGTNTGHPNYQRKG